MRSDLVRLWSGRNWNADSSSDDHSSSGSSSDPEADAALEAMLAKYMKDNNIEDMEPSSDCDDDSSSSSDDSSQHRAPTMPDPTGGDRRQLYPTKSYRKFLKKEPSLYGRKIQSSRHLHVRPRNKLACRVSGFWHAVPDRMTKPLQIHEDRNQIWLVEERHEWVEEVCQKMWMSDDDLSASKANVQADAEACDGEDETIEARGLESKTKRGSWNSYKARKAVIDAVLDEMDKQAERSGSYDWEDFEEASLDVSEVYQKEARQRAEQDALDAAEYLQDVRAEWTELEAKLAATHKRAAQQLQRSVSERISRRNLTTMFSWKFRCGQGTASRRGSSGWLDATSFRPKGDELVAQTTV